MSDEKTEEPAVPFIHLSLVEGKWRMESNLQEGQAKWSICEIAATLMSELRPKV